MGLATKKNISNSTETKYAIVDIETTGGSVSGSRITEVAILLHDGNKVVSRWSSLINPEMEIPLHITALTGIDDEMVAKAPIFAEVAEKIYSLLKDKIFVAHNVNFDYSFLRAQLAACGQPWDATKLCTVRLSRKLLPGLNSYSLGKLCSQVGINLKDRHRAMGDALATAELFSILIEKDTEGLIAGMVRKVSPEQRLPSNVPTTDFAALPECPGVYYFHDQKGKVIYVGKAINLKKRVASHFTGNNTTLRRQNFLNDIYHISFERCGSELMALLLECTEIQKHWPIHNRALKRFEAKFGLYHYVAVSGYSYLAVGKLPKQQHCLKAFDNEAEAVSFLADKSRYFEIDNRFCRYGNASVFYTDLPLPNIEQHNLNVEKFLSELDESVQQFALMLDGRDQNEKGIVWVENGKVYGMGYLDESMGQDMEQIKESLTRCKSNYYMLKLVIGFADRYPHRVLYPAINDHRQLA
ncbi:exonuclease domain-containing protein [Pedobacter sp. SL55]|uniref:exonuclease domain-containing protein n=1 Tax=Pedobacter sp. SL55 TaxID=2995161 RepID=UPI002271FE81|nr:exonuclease domain-containing protein [Pedobacter sp. SL55]WAC40185.1 exonuclease domain-containing protein [Pedobacter sp. SL55]